MAPHLTLWGHPKRSTLRFLPRLPTLARLLRQHGHAPVHQLRGWDGATPGKRVPVSLLQGDRAGGLGEVMRDGFRTVRTGLVAQRFQKHIEMTSAEGRGQPGKMVG